MPAAVDAMSCLPGTGTGTGAADLTVAPAPPAAPGTTAPVAKAGEDAPKGLLWRGHDQPPVRGARNDTSRQVPQPNPGSGVVGRAAGIGGEPRRQPRPPGQLPGFGPPGLRSERRLPHAALRGNGGTKIPPALVAAVFAQESALYQASRRALPGVSGNPEIGNYYGDDVIDGHPLTRIDYEKSDCGYGISQVTTWMTKTIVDPGDVDDR